MESAWQHLKAGSSNPSGTILKVFFPATLLKKVKGSRHKEICIKICLSHFPHRHYRIKRVHIFKPIRSGNGLRSNCKTESVELFFIPLHSIKGMTSRNMYLQFCTTSTYIWWRVLKPHVKFSVTNSIRVSYKNPHASKRDENTALCSNTALKRIPYSCIQLSACVFTCVLEALATRLSLSGMVC